MEVQNDLLITNIQRFSVDDGPGIRTTIFLKGCNLKCRWCHNPENISCKPVLQFKKDLCVSCKKCALICERGVHHIEGGKHDIIRDGCLGCGMCTQVCLNKALTILGRKESAEKLFSEILKDKDYYDKSGGGVTFSGGEPMLQYQGLLSILKLCREKGIHTAVDTAGAVPYEYFEKVIPYTDLFLYDIKCISNDIHRKYTGADNRGILSNLLRLSEDNAEIIVRIPLIKGVNTDEKEIRAMAEFLSGLQGVKLYELLPYHDYGIGKYELLGMNAGQEDFEAPPEEEMERIRALFCA